jgi:hypothetical protein
MQETEEKKTQQYEKKERKNEQDSYSRSFPISAKEVNEKKKKKSE